jgi:hypothetical protein
VLDHIFPDDTSFTKQKAKALEWTALQPEPPIDHAIRSGAGCTPRALDALIAEGSLVRVGQHRYYVPLKVQVRGKTFYHEPRSVTEWKKKAGSRVTDIDNLWRRETHK